MADQIDKNQPNPANAALAEAAKLELAKIETAKAEAAAKAEEGAKAEEAAAPEAAKVEAAKAEIAKAKKPRAKPEAETSTETDGLMTVSVIGPASGRRRAGFNFGANPTVVNVTQDQLDIIEADGTLSVTKGQWPAGAAEAVADAGGSVAMAERLPIEAFKGAVCVIGPASGRRRAGQMFGKEAVTFTPTRDQLEAILADPLLSVQPA